MKINHRRKDKWFKEGETGNDRFSDPKKVKAERRDKHLTKNKRLHQYQNLRNLFDDIE